MNPLLLMLMGQGGQGGEGGFVADTSGPLFSRFLRGVGDNGLFNSNPDIDKSPGQSAQNMGAQQMGMLNSQLMNYQPGQGEHLLAKQVMDEKSYKPNTPFLEQFNDRLRTPWFSGTNTPGQLSAFSHQAPPIPPNEVGVLPPVGAIPDGGFTPVAGGTPNPPATTISGVPLQEPTNPGPTPWSNLFSTRGNLYEPNVFLKGGLGYNMGGLMGALGAMLTDFSPNSDQNNYVADKKAYDYNQNLKKQRGVQ